MIDLDWNELDKEIKNNSEFNFTCINKILNNN